MTTNTQNGTTQDHEPLPRDDRDALDTRIAELDRLSRRVLHTATHVRAMVEATADLNHKSEDRIVANACEIADKVLRELGDDLTMAYADYTIPELRVRILPNGEQIKTVYTKLVPYGEAYAAWEMRNARHSPENEQIADPVHRAQARLSIIQKARADDERDVTAIIRGIPRHAEKRISFSHSKQMAFVHGPEDPNDVDRYLFERNQTNGKMELTHCVRMS